MKTDPRLPVFKDRFVPVRLSEREIEYIRLRTGEALQCKEIATRMNISVRAVKFYQECLRFKLNFAGHFCIELTKFAIKNGIIEI